MLLSRLLANSKIEYMIVDESGRLCRGVHTGIEIEEIFSYLLNA